MDSRTNQSSPLGQPDIYMCVVEPECPEDAISNKMIEPLQIVENRFGEAKSNVEHPSTQAATHTEPPIRVPALLNKPAITITIPEVAPQSLEKAEIDSPNKSVEIQITPSETKHSPIQNLTLTPPIKTLSSVDQKQESNKLQGFETVQITSIKEPQSSSFNKKSMTKSFNQCLRALLACIHSCEKRSSHKLQV
jgi:hypothetical protein